MNSEARTSLLYSIGQHLCQHCGHYGSSRNKLEFHYCEGRSKPYSYDDGQSILRIAQDRWEYEHWHDAFGQIIVLCHECHVKAHSGEQEREDAEDKALIEELTRYRFCVNKNVSCSYKSCQLCDEYRSVIE
jgi:magnesium-transporting ATPase (P-type)